MLSIISLFAFLVAYSNADYCPGPAYRVANCTSKPISSGCTNWYQWSFNANMDYGDQLPWVCFDDPSTGMCKMVGTWCTPPCQAYATSGSLQPNSIVIPKIGGPPGKVCNDFSGNIGNNKQTCIKSYMEQDEGDRWCFWRDNSNYCYRGIVCYN